MEYGEYINGYIERKSDGVFEGELVIEGGINLSPIEAQFFKTDGITHIWLKRKRALEYDEKSQMFKKREREPRWECYLKKQLDGESVAYKGEFVFMHFRFSIKGILDNVLGNDKKRRINLFVDRMPMEKQTIINSINYRNRNGRKD